MADTTEKPNTNGSTSTEEVVDGDSVEQQDSRNSSYRPNRGTTTSYHDDEVTLFTIFNNLISAVVFSTPAAKYASASLLQRIRTSLSGNVPLLREGSRNSARRVLRWTRRGGPLRALFVVSVGTIMLLALTGLLVFMLFFIAATTNAIIISLLMSLAAAGGFLAFFFACVTAIYIGALSVAIFVISATTISAIIATLVVTGWIGFFWAVWLATKKSVSLVKHSLSISGSALSAYSAARHARRYK